MQVGICLLVFFFPESKAPFIQKNGLKKKKNAKYI